MKDEWKGCEEMKAKIFCVNRGMAIDTLELYPIWLTRQRYFQMDMKRQWEIR